MPDVLLRQVDHRHIEAIDAVLAVVSRNTAAAQAEGDERRIRDGWKLLDMWLDQRLRFRG